jgi:hypothetical protein
MKPDLSPETVSSDDDDDDGGGGGGINGDSDVVTSDENDGFSNTSSRFTKKSK